MKTNFNIKFLIVLIITLVITSAFINTDRNDCDDAKDAAQNAYDYFRKAYRSGNIEDVKYYAKKGMNEASTAEDESTDSECDCDDAESTSSEAYSYGKKAYNSENLDDAIRYSKKAMYAAEETTSNAEDCEE